MAQASGTSIQLEEFVEAAIAGMDRAVQARSEGAGPGGRFRPHPIWFGFVFDGPLPWPTEPDLPGEEEEEDLDDVIFRAAKDHTLIVEAAFRHAIPLVKSLGLTADRKKQLRPDQALDALRELSLDPEEREAVERAMSARSSVATRRGGASAIGRRLDLLRGELAGADSVDDRIDKLTRMAREHRQDEDGFGISVALAAEMLRQGRDTIYDPAFYDRFVPGTATAKEKDTAEEISDADVEGAVAGALGGLFAGAGPVTAVGAGAGAGAAASVGKAVVAIIDWIFD